MRSGRSWRDETILRGGYFGGHRIAMSATSSQAEQIEQRRANLAALARLGIDVYPRSFVRRDTIAELVERYGQRTHDELEADRIETVTSGRILAIRSFGKANFLVLSDGIAKVQAYIRQDS